MLLGLLAMIIKVTLNVVVVNIYFLQLMVIMVFLKLKKLKKTVELAFLYILVLIPQDSAVMIIKAIIFY